jgi:CxxC motif-containing protein (DUF1111 family)
VRNLPAPAARAPVDDQDEARIKAGGTTFRSIGCAQCHVPKLGDVAGIYSDLLLHDIGPELADTAGYGVFTGSRTGFRGLDPAGGLAPSMSQQWRTPPLWGLSDSGPYLHDGRAGTLDQAIRLHGGEAEQSALRYAHLTPLRRRQLDAFLRSLGVPADGGGT